MGERQRKWAAKTRDRLIRQLGGRCARCSKFTDLQFDCIVPQGTVHHREWEWSQRMSFYKVQLALDNLQLLCEECHGRKTREDNTALGPLFDGATPTSIEPFNESPINEDNEPF